MRNIANILIGLFVSLNLFGQTITERFILTDTKDSIFLKAGWREASFDRQGNYCFIVKKDKQRYFITNKDTIEINSLSSGGGVGGSMHYTYSYKFPDMPYYYTNIYGTKVYGPIIGREEAIQTSGTRENVAVVTTLNDTAYY